MSSNGTRTTTKKELVNRIADRTGHTKVVVKEVLQAFLDEMIQELALGNRLEFREFGVFEVRERKARRAQNPRTLEKVEVPAKRVVKFKVGRTMRQRVCEDPPPAQGRLSTTDQGARGPGGARGTRATGDRAPSGLDPAAEDSQGRSGRTSKPPTNSPF